ncbi:hypothetical protein DFP72DRAFT_593287 [Ephemerocybe angulata]|uniref:DUF6589 domain-containing protein n=1 Tax=Ephemerocybe angulata TaxID=980116 RepID=A0A8H6ID22_9AGAR|nr:hypothetical protein DFP72DRAFT_593287 [Tulosesus angulatus]
MAKGKKSAAKRRQNRKSTQKAAKEPFQTPSGTTETAEIAADAQTAGAPALAPAAGSSTAALSPPTAQNDGDGDIEMLDGETEPRNAVEGATIPVGDSVAGSSQNIAGSASTTEAPSVSAPRRAAMSYDEKIDSVLQFIKDIPGISPFDVFKSLVDAKAGPYDVYRRKYYEKDNSRLPDTLSLIANDPQGRSRIKSWIHSPAGRELVTEIISAEMDGLVDDMKLTGVADIDPEHIRNRAPPKFNVQAPFTLSLLVGAAQTKRAKGKNVMKAPDQLCDIVLGQLVYQRSNRVLGFATEFGLFLWHSGCSRQTIEALHRCGLSISYTAISTALKTLSDHCMKKAVGIAAGPHAFCYDNINISTSIFVEQRGGSTPAKVTSGTLGMVYRLKNATLEDMKLAPILARLRDPCYNMGLDFNRDLVLTDQQSMDVVYQFKVSIIQVLLRHVKGFEKRQKDPTLQHKAIRKLPPDHIAEFQLLRVSTTEEATVKGNLQFQEECYTVQLERTPEELSKYAIPTINDQLTNSRIRSGQLLRAGDTNEWNRRSPFQTAPGMFHFGMNAEWMILGHHRGDVHTKGTLAYWGSVLDKRRIASDNPDYHTVLTFFRQVLEGHILNAWRIVVAEDAENAARKEKARAAANPTIPPTKVKVPKTLPEYAKSNPSSDALFAKATDILDRFATPLPTPVSVPAPTTAEADHPVPASTPWTGPDPVKDIVHQNTLLLTRDLLYFFEIIDAVKDGDFGRIENILPVWAIMFRGGGGNNYCTETLHLIQNLKYLWPPKFANVMRDTVLVNLSGIPGHTMAADLNMEHGIKEVKETIILKGLETTWDMMERASPCINEVKEIKQKIVAMLKLPYQNKTHSDVDTSALVWRVADKLKEEGLQKYMPNREGNDTAKAVGDLIEDGAKKMRSSTIKTFNKKFASLIQGQHFEPDPDDARELTETLEPNRIVLGSERDTEEDSEEM